MPDFQVEGAERFGRKHAGALALGALGIGAVTILLASSRRGVSQPKAMAVPPDTSSTNAPPPPAGTNGPDVSSLLGGIRDAMQAQAQAQQASQEGLQQRLDAEIQATRDQAQAAIDQTNQQQQNYMQQVQQERQAADQKYQDLLATSQAERASQAQAYQSYTQSATAMLLEKLAGRGLSSQNDTNSTLPPVALPAPAANQMTTQRAPVEPTGVAADGQSLASQTPDIITTFMNTWGSLAPARWAYEHNKAIGAA